MTFMNPDSPRYTSDVWCTLIQVAKKNSNQRINVFSTISISGREKWYITVSPMAKIRIRKAGNHPREKFPTSPSVSQFPATFQGEGLEIPHSLRKMSRILIG
jgi:hypothetical protein